MNSINSFIVETEHNQLRLTPLWPLRFEQVLQCKSWLALTPLHAGTLDYGADLIQLTFTFAGQPFCFCYEDNSESYWITADSAGSVMLLSELAKEFSNLRIK